MNKSPRFLLLTTAFVLSACVSPTPEQKSSDVANRTEAKTAKEVDLACKRLARAIRAKYAKDKGMEEIMLAELKASQVGWDYYYTNQVFLFGRCYGASDERMASYGAELGRLRVKEIDDLRNSL